MQALARVPARSARRRSSAVISSSARYFSITVSSKLVSTSISWWRASSASAASCSGIAAVTHSSPMPSSQISACIPSRSMTPRNSDSAPIGSWMTAGQAVEPVLDHLDAPLEVRADAVHLVHEADARHAVLVGLAPHRLGLGLDAGDGVEDRDRAVEHAQGPLDLDGEVDVAGRVDDVDQVVVPVARRRRRRDGDARALALGPSSPWSRRPRGPRRSCSCGPCSTGCARSSWSCRRRCAP